MSDNLYYVIECTAEEIVAEFLVNDIPLVRRGKDCGHFYGAPINEFLVSGINEIAVVLEPGPTPGRAVAGPRDGRTRSVPDPEAKVLVTLSTYPKGAVVGGPDKKELMRLEWKPQAKEPVVFPHVLTTTVELQLPFPVWRHLGLDPVVLDATTRGELDAFLADLHLSLQGAMVEPTVEKNQLRYEEVEIAHYLPKGDREAFVTNQLPDMMERSYWGVQPLDASPADPRLCAGNRMVQLVAEDWRASLRRNPDSRDNVVFFDMMVGKIDGKWLVLR